jgi:hypothetical protein
MVFKASIPKSGKLWVAEPQPLMVVELDSALLGAPVQDPTDPTDQTASTRHLNSPQLPSLQDETILTKQVLILQG